MFQGKRCVPTAYTAQWIGVANTPRSEAKTCIWNLSNGSWGSPKNWVRNVPVEATEAITPLVIWRKELRQDSGGAGKYRGGLGQVMEVASRENAPFGIFARFERVTYPARGRHGGGPGGAGRLSLASGTILKAKGLAVVPPGDRLIVEMPGGGGMGAPAERDPATVRRDVRLGYLSREAAEREYGVEL